MSRMDLDGGERQARQGKAREGEVRRRSNACAVATVRAGDASDEGDEGGSSDDVKRIARDMIEQS